MEKLKPTIRPRSVRHAASTVRKSSRACGPSDAYLPSSLAPIQAHAHKAMKVSTSMRKRESVRRLIANNFLSPVTEADRNGYATNFSDETSNGEVERRPRGTPSGALNNGLTSSKPHNHIQHEQRTEQHARRSNAKDWTQFGLREHVSVEQEQPR